MAGRDALVRGPRKNHIVWFLRLRDFCAERPPMRQSTTRSRWDKANDDMFIRRALGESMPAMVLLRAMVWGPHEVGGAQPGAERL